MSVLVPRTVKRTSFGMFACGLGGPSCNLSSRNEPIDRVARKSSDHPVGSGESCSYQLVPRGFLSGASHRPVDKRRVKVVKVALTTSADTVPIGALRDEK